jgi:anhydro-N-acetylmuramic acid kinase
MNIFLGHLYSKLIVDYLKEKKTSPQKIDFIGSHGQTVCHLPKRTKEHQIEYCSTLQIGDPSVIAAKTGIVTVGDFRVADVALGGEGAPLVPIFDYLYFQNPKKSRLLLNIGGIANFTFLPATCKFDEVLAFDTGPGNIIIDSLSMHFFHVPFDRDGCIARKGTVQKDLLEYLLKDEYFYRKPPKSTGREKFAGDYLQKILDFSRTKKIKPEDVLSTSTELTVKTIFEAAENFLPTKSTLDELIVSGGGAENKVLMERLTSYFLKTKILKSDDLGLRSDAKEAICFAILAYHTLLNKPSNLPSVTGASHQTLLGKICVPYMDSK